MSISETCFRKSPLTGRAGFRARRQHAAFDRRLRRAIVRISERDHILREHVSRKQRHAQTAERRESVLPTRPDVTLGFGMPVALSQEGDEIRRIQETASRTTRTNGGHGPLQNRRKPVSLQRLGRMAELADAQDLKSCEGNPSCGFKSRSGYLSGNDLQLSPVVSTCSSV